MLELGSYWEFPWMKSVVTLSIFIYWFNWSKKEHDKTINGNKKPRAVPQKAR